MILLKNEKSVTKIAGHTETKSMSKTNVGPNLLFVLQTITGIKSMSGNVWGLVIGSVLVIVRRRT